ncbi:MAG TPA: flagellar assembly protein A, partial [Spirochaetia bacterium]
MPASINLEQLQEYMRKQSEEDKRNRSITVEAESVQEALKKASIELGIPVRDLEYETIARGRPGTLGIGKTPWKLNVYERSRVVKTSVEVEEETRREVERQAEAETHPRDVPGEVFVRITADGAFLRVTRPEGRGARATEITAVERLSLRGVRNYDAALVSKIVKHADGEFVRVAEVQYNPSHDATVSLDITDGAMKAVVVISEPGPGGADVSADYLRSYLQSNGVVSGILETVMAEIESSPRYGRPIVAAEGTRAHDGADAKIVYNFNLEKDAVQLREKDGRVDFKDISRVENVVAGQLLARKEPAEPGQAGQTVTGTMIPATKGRDCELLVGKNVKLSEDGLSALAEINGQVLVLAGKINVEPV